MKAVGLDAMEDLLAKPITKAYYICYYLWQLLWKAENIQASTSWIL